MTLTITKRELLALCFHVQPKRLDSLEHVRFRRQVWEAFDAKDLAQDVAELARSPRVNISLDWMDRATQLTGELEDGAVKWLRDVLAPPYDGPDADLLYDIREKLTEK